MKVVRVLNGLPELSGSVGFVPTMGALHEGHLSLIRSSKDECDQTVISIFVNPLQFGPKEDFTLYPRPEERDIELATDAGADVIYIPPAEELTARIDTAVVVSGVTKLYEGAHRPGHFDGVSTIVANLFNLVRPDFAYFGLKDRQQCAVIRKMVADLNMPIQLRLMSTVREADGLALSSRNVYLSESERRVAPSLYAVLNDCRDSIRIGKPVEEAVAASVLGLGNLGFTVDYLDVVDEATFQPTQTVAESSVIVVAARLGKTRLIDNLSLLDH